MIFANTYRSRVPEAWEPGLKFEEGLEKTVRWYLENSEWLENVTSGDYLKYYEEMISPALNTSKPGI